VSEQDEQGRVMTSHPSASCWDQTAEVALWLRLASAQLRGIPSEA